MNQRAGIRWKAAAPIGAARPSAPEAWPPDSSSSFAGASVGAARPSLVSLLQISQHY